MGIRFYCPNGHKLHVKSFLAGMRGICPHCGARVQIPLQSTRPSSKELKRRKLQAAQQKQQAANAATGSADISADAQALSFLADQTSPEATGQNTTQVTHDAEGGNVASQETRGAEQSSSSHGQAAGDPFAEAPNAVWYVIPPTGGQYGPASAEVMKTWLSEGRITADTLVWREGWPDWKDAKDVFPELAIMTPPDEVLPGPVLTGPMNEDTVIPTIAEQLGESASRFEVQQRGSAWKVVAWVVGVLVIVAVLAGAVWYAYTHT